MVAAVVVSHNTAALLRACLDGLRPTPTWVVDNASTDDSAAVARRAGAHVIERPDNPGFGRAVNLAARAAGDWDWLVIANADAAPRPGALDALLAAGADDPAAGILAPRLLRPGGAVQHSVFAFWDVRFVAALNAGRQRRDPAWGADRCVPGYWDPEVPRRVPWAVGAFLLVRRAAWEAVGGFDERQWLYAEDVSLGWRAGQAGWATRYVPDAMVDHAEAAATAPRWGDARTERWVAATYEWMLRARGPARTRAVAAINLAGALAQGERGWARAHALGLLPQARLRRRIQPSG